jgi:hypothetical protein
VTQSTGTWRVPCPTVELQEKPILNLCEFHGRGAFSVVVSHSIKPTAFQPNSTLTATSNFEQYFFTSFAAYFSQNFLDRPISHHATAARGSWQCPFP